MSFILDSFMLELLIIIIALIYCSYIYFSSTFNYWKVRGFPYVKPTVFFRNIKDFLLGNTTIFKIDQDLYNCLTGHKYGGYFAMTKPILMIRDPELIERILIKDFTYFHDRGLPTQEEDKLSLNLANADGERWRNLRYKLTPTFTSGKLKGMFEQFSRCCDDLVKYIEEESKREKQFDGKALMNRYFMNVIATCAFGIEFSYHDKERDKFLKIVKQMANPSITQLIKAFFQLYCPKVSKFFKIKSIDPEVENYFFGLVKETIRYREETNFKRNDFLQLLLTLKKQEENGKDMDSTTDYASEDAVINQLQHAPRQEQKPTEKKQLFTDECITAQAVVFLSAGADIGTGILNFCLFSVATHSDIQNKLQIEADAALAKHGQWSYQMLKELTYIDQVIQETMRIYPVSTFLIRMCTKPYQVPDNDVILEPGTTVTIPVYSLHHDPQHYPDPEKFDPDRFLETNYKPSGTYLPFGDGPRICIAMRFAVLQMKACLARIISEYTVKLGNKTQTPLQFVPRSLILQPKGGIWIEFEKRKK